jgi:GxGYxYP putative glycoside hydrolase C-terminal domain/GxGYxYP third domain/GxGYxYP_N second domain/GxGYxYP_N 1st domain
MRRPRVAMALSLVAMLAGGACRGQAPAGLPESVAREVTDVAALPKGTYSLVRSWQAETAGHLTGRLVDDPDAEGGKAWEVKPGVDAAADTMIFGPYVEVPRGSYVAFFRMELLEAAEDDIPARLDACVQYAQNMLGACEVAGADLRVGQYVEVPLGFVYDRGQLECRVTWLGGVGLRVDSISLFRVEGVDLSRGFGRVPEAVPSGLPKDLTYRKGARPFPDLFPRSGPPAKELLVCDLTKERADWRLLLYSLQGLVNRTTPRIYCLSVVTDSFWLDQMKERGCVESTRPVTPQELLKQFGDDYKGLIVTDPALPASRNVATMLASVSNGLVASPRLARELGLPVLEDLRGRWKTSAEAYRWAFDNLWPRLNHYVIACLWPDHLALRDYLVENKVFIFWMSGALDGARKYASPNDEVRLTEELLARMPANIPVMGYPWAGKDMGIGEGPGVSLFAEFGKYLVGSIDVTNLSVHSGIELPDPRQRPAPPAPELEAGKVYVSLILSDGDNLPVLTINNFPQLWADKLRGQFPIGWTMSPSAMMLIPDVVDYYYRTATPNDDFLGAVSGVGYTYPDLYGKRFRPADRRRVYDDFLAQTAEYMKRSDERAVWIMNATRPEVIARFAEEIPFLDALFPDYGRRVLTADEATYPTARNVPVFHAVTGWRMEATREERIAEMVSDVRRMTPAQRPAFLHVFLLNWFVDLRLIQETLKQLGPEYVAVRPDHLAELWRQEMARRQVTMRLVSSAAAIEDQTLTLRGSLRNVAERTFVVDLRVREGLEGAEITPIRVEAAPGREVTVTVHGRPAGARVVLEMTGAFGTRTAEVALRTVPRSELLGPVPAAGTLVPAAYLEAEALAHRSGASQPDAQASGGEAWLAEKGETEPGYVVFGPYAPLDAGEYVALFRVKRTGEGAGQLATLDTCVAGGSPQTRVREIGAQELPLNQWRWVPVRFRHPGGNYETRVQWSGAASMAIDCIAVWRVE